MPAGLELRNRGEVLRISLFHATIYPFADGADFGIGQAWVIRELANIRICVPWGHEPLYYLFANGGSPGPCFFVGHQRHGSDVVGVRANDAVLIENRSHIFAVCDFFPCRSAAWLSGLR